MGNDEFRPCVFCSGEFDALKQENERLAAQVGTRTGESALSQVDTLRTELQQTREEAESRSDLLVSKAAAIERLKEERDTACRLHDEIGAAFTKLEQQLAQSQAETENQTSKLKDEISLHHDRVAAYVNDVHVLKTERDALQARLDEAVACLTELLKMVKEDEASPVMHNENCSAWCHYRPILERSAAFLAAQRKENTNA